MTPPRDDGLARRARVRRAATVVALLAVYWLAAVTAARSKSPTVDEIPHLTAGYSYWLAFDYRLNPQAGLLPQMWAALPLWLDPPTFPPSDLRAWRQSDEWAMGTEFFYGSGNDPEAMLLRGRMMIALVGVLLGLLVYGWSRRLFGERGGLLSLLLFVASPSMLAHGALVTSDMAAAAALTAAVGSIGFLLQRVSLASFLGGVVALAALVLSKMSAPVIVPIAVLLLLVQRVRRRPWKLAAAALAAQLLLAWLLVWGAYGFRYSAFAESEPGRGAFRVPWPALVANAGAARPVLEFARDGRLLPEAYLYGATHALGLTRSGQSTFLNGRYERQGFWLFFPYCLLVKTPIPVFALLLAAAIGARAGPRAPAASARLLDRTAPLWTLLAVYWAASIAAPLNIGHRHLLPTYPALFILAGAASTWFDRRTWKTALAVGLCLVTLVAQSARTWPDYLSYFNEIAGGPRHGYRHLVDSSLDWGQDLPALKRWLDGEARGKPVYLSYFGTARPEHYGIEAIRLPSVPSVEIGEGDDPTSAPLRGGVYCISATLLQSVYGAATGPWTAAKEEKYRQLQEAIARRPAAVDARSRRLFAGLRLAKLCAFLRTREPDAAAGHSILIYRLGDDDLRRALAGAS